VWRTGPEWQVQRSAPVPRGGRRIPVRAVLAAALLSAILSSGGTYAVVTLTAPRQLASAPAAHLTSTGAAAAAAPTVAGSADAIVGVAAEASHSIVTITTTGMSGFSPFSVPETGVGSGFVVSTTGLILTANHVVAGNTSLTVTLPDGRQVSAAVVSTDPQHDVALIRATASGLVPLPLGDSSNLTVGELAVAVGSPLGTFNDTVTSGIVSALDRTITVSEPGFGRQTQLSGLIQTDAAINPGNSGGPLLDASGNVIGMITAQASGAEGVGFAEPINAARTLMANAPAA
jgi:S1-C subfamily serine protease